MKQRLPLVISATALVVALFGSTPLGHAVVSAVPPFAKKAGYATNAGAVNHITAARTPTPGSLVPLGVDGKFPASVGQVGPAGPQGATNVTVKAVQLSGTGQLYGDAQCAAGQRAVGGGFYAGGNGGFVTVLNSYPTPLTDGATPTGWHVTVVNQQTNTASMTGAVYAVCASP